MTIKYDSDSRVTSTTGEQLLREYLDLLEADPTDYKLIGSLVGTVLPMIGGYKQGDAPRITPVKKEDET